MSRPLHVLRPVLREHVLNGGTPKEFAFTHGMNLPNVGKLLGALGLRKYYLTRDEHAQVMKRRKATRRAAA